MFICIAIIIVLELVNLNVMVKFYLTLLLILYLGIGFGLRFSIKSDEMYKKRMSKQEKTPSAWLYKEVTKLPLELDYELKWKKVNEEFNGETRSEKIKWLVNSVKLSFSSMEERKAIISILSISPSKKISDIIVTIILSISGIQLFLKAVPLIVKLSKVYSTLNNVLYPYVFIVLSVCILSVLFSLIYKYIVVPINTEKKEKCI